MAQKFDVCVLGATGLVGKTIIEIEGEENDIEKSIIELGLGLKSKLKSGLLQLDSINIFFNDDELSSPYILSATLNPEFYNNDIEAILMYLDINGVAVSSGSACTSGTLKPSHVILGCGQSTDYANGTIRFSFGKNNTEEDIVYVLNIMEQMLSKFKL